MIAELDKIINAIQKLSLSDQETIASKLSVIIDQKQDNNKLQDKFLEKRFADGFCCPHCGKKEHIIKFGKQPNGEQRYRCRNCGRTFNARYNTIYFGTHKSLVKWAQFHECMANKMSLRQAAEICDINKDTAFVWRHKTLDATNKFFSNKVMKGVIEADETFFRTSLKDHVIYQGKQKNVEPL